MSVAFLVLAGRVAAGGFAYAANVGWIDCRVGQSNGLAVSEFVCSGWAWSANTGWVCFGNGTPRNGVRYTNDSAADYGVNHERGGRLRGFAWSASTGWICFAEEGDPRLDLVTGEVHGCVYGANLGWIALDPAAAALLRIPRLQPAPDVDADGIPDAWEIERTRWLGALRAGHDLDGDGVTDDREYVADTDPRNAAEFLAMGRGEAAFPFLDQQRLLVWPYSPARVYWLDVSTNLLSGEWESFLLVPGRDGPDDRLQPCVVVPPLRCALVRVRAALPLRGLPAGRTGRAP